MRYFGENERLTPFSSTQIFRCYFIYERMTEFDGKKIKHIFVMASSGYYVSCPRDN